MIHIKRVILLLVAVLSSTIVSLAPLSTPTAYAAAEDPAEQVERWLYYRGMRACLEKPDWARTQGVAGQDDNDGSRTKTEINDGHLLPGGPIYENSKEAFGYLAPEHDGADTTNKADDNEGTLQCDDGSLWQDGAAAFGFPDVMSLICAMNDAMSDDELNSGHRIEPSNGTDCEASDKITFHHVEDSGTIWQRALTKALEAEYATEHGGDGDRPPFDFNENEGDDYSYKAMLYILGKKSLELFCGNSNTIEEASVNNRSYENDDDVVSVFVVELDGTIKRSQSYPIDNTERNENSKVHDVYYYWDDNDNEGSDRTCADMARWTREGAEDYALYLQNTDTPPTDEDPDTPSGSTDPVCSAGALGWVICPAMSLMADVTTWVAGQLESYLRFNPFAAGSEIKTVWSSLLAIANSLLVVAFLIVIFSQSTSVGLSSYGVKKMLPRIIAAAILMNLSYYICQILVDLSNIAGVGIASLVSSVTSGSFTDNVENVSNLSKVLVGAGIVAIVAFFFLIPVALSFLAVIFTIAARNALIVLLVMVAPLAFAAWILPNTEKYFRKWWELLINLLLLFPLVMLIFSASIVAANVIASNPPSGGAGSTELNGMVALLVLALPLFAMPFMFKIAGSALSRINALTQQQLQRGADSKAGQFARNKTKAYGKFGAFAAGAGAARGLNKASNGRMFNPDKPGRITRGYRNVRGFDKAIETSLEARKQGRQTEFQERAAHLGTTGVSKNVLQGVGGSRYQEIAAAQVEKAFADRKSAIKAALDQRAPAADFNAELKGFKQEFAQAVQTGDAAKAGALVDYLSSARGAPGRETLEQALVENAKHVKAGSDVHTALNNAINRDNYSTLVSKRGGIAKGGFKQAADGSLGFDINLGSVGTEQLATQDFKSLSKHFDQINAEEAKAVLGNEELLSKISDVKAREVLKAAAAGTANPLPVDRDGNEIFTGPNPPSGNNPV